MIAATERSMSRPMITRAMGSAMIAFSVNAWVLSNRL